jgi:hypothetical protein
MNISNSVFYRNLCALLPSRPNFCGPQGFVGFPSLYMQPDKTLRRRVRFLSLRSQTISDEISAPVSQQQLRWACRNARRFAYLFPFAESPFRRDHAGAEGSADKPPHSPLLQFRRPVV